MSSFGIAIILATCFFQHGLGDSLHCKEVKEMGPSRDFAQLKVLYRGPKGEAGENGDPGRNGRDGSDGRVVVDYPRVFGELDSKLKPRLESLIAAVENKFSSFLDSFQDKLPEGVSLTTTAAPTTTAPATTTERTASRIAELKSQGLCALEYEKRCFWANIGPTANLDRRLAQFNCGLFGGNLANIYSQSHYDGVLEIAREKMPTFVETGILSLTVWTGMSVNRLNGSIEYRDGSAATFVQWREDVYPYDSFNRPYVSIHLRRTSAGGDQGMWNTNKDKRFNGNICEI